MQEEVNAIVAKLAALLEETEDEVFSLAIVELMNNHPKLRSYNPLLQWDLLLLAKGYEHEAVFEAAAASAIEMNRTGFEQLYQQS